MELVLRASALALCTALITLVVKKTNPEISLLLSAAVVTAVTISAAGFLRGLKELTDMLRDGFGISDIYLLPVLKCMAIAVVSKLAGDLCRDSSQAAAASSVEFAGTVCAMGTILPLMVSVLRLIGGLI